MAYLVKGRNLDLIELCQILDILIDENFKILKIKDGIVKNSNYDGEFTKECLTHIINEHKELELREDKEKENQWLFELQKLQIQANSSTNTDSSLVSSSGVDCAKNGVLNFDPKEKKISIFLEYLKNNVHF